MNSVQPMIGFRGVSKTYGENCVLDHVDLSIDKGEFVTLIGRSGCGKTTLLKMINALIRPDQGSVWVDGRDVSQVDQIMLRRNIGYVIQNVGLFPHMTVQKNIEYVPSLFKQRPSPTVEPEKLMEMVSLEKELLKRYPGELSGGQKQRVGIARALAVTPSILLMDEPFGAVDEITRKQLQSSIQKIHRELGITIIFVTHAIDEALLLGTKTAILGDRNVLQYDTPERILTAPADLFVKELTGGVSLQAIQEARLGEER